MGACKILIYLNLGVLLVVYNLEHLKKNGHGHHAKLMLWWWWSWFCELGLLPREYVIKNMQCHITYRASITLFFIILFSWKVVTWSLWRWVVLSGQGLHICCVHMWLTTYLNHVGGYWVFVMWLICQVFTLIFGRIYLLLESKWMWTKFQLFLCFGHCFFF